MALALELREAEAAFNRGEWDAGMEHLRVAVEEAADFPKCGLRSAKVVSTVRKPADRAKP